MPGHWLVLEDIGSSQKRQTDRLLNPVTKYVVSFSQTLTLPSNSSGEWAGEVPLISPCTCTCTCTSLIVDTCVLRVSRK